jgi:hypothetical protein
MGVAEGKPVDRVSGRQPLDPAVQVRRADPPQHRIDELGRTGTHLRSRQIHCRSYRGVRWNPGVQCLVCAKAQHIPDRRVQLIERSVETLAQHDVVRSEPAKCAVDQLGRQSGVPLIEAAVPE